jgi:hypothetical protein
MYERCRKGAEMLCEEASFNGYDVVWSVGAWTTRLKSGENPGNAVSRARHNTPQCTR